MDAGAAKKQRRREGYSRVVQVLEGRERIHPPELEEYYDKMLAFAKRKSA